MNYLTCTRGVRSWLLTLDHKRIGVMYLCAILTSFLLGGLFAVLLRTTLLSGATGTDPAVRLVGPKTYNQLFTLHGAIMVFLVIIPGIPAALGNFALPLMLGAKDVAFPRLNLLSWYLYMTGLVMALAALAMGPVDTGWTFYTPYSTQTDTAVIMVVLAAFILGFSSILTGLNFIVTIHKLRAPGLGWFQMPALAWALYATGIIQILATPVVGITLLLLVAERTLNVGIFDPAMGGDPVLFQHFFWFYSHPAVYIMVLPAMGVVSELVSTFSHKRLFGYTFIVFSSVAIALLSFLVWGHHMYVSGQSALAGQIFSAITMCVAVPSGIKVFNWLATMYRGNLVLQTPLLYALAFIFIFGIGGLTGLFLGSLSVDVHLHDTYFVVAHFHYTMASTILVFIGGLHYWWPKMTGRCYCEPLAKVAWALVFVGFMLTFIPQFLMGAQGMPRRYYSYPEEFAPHHHASTGGSFLMAAGFVLQAAYLAYSLFKGKRAPANPWGGGSLEWRTPSPPPLENFDPLPDHRDPYDASDFRWDDAEQGYVLRTPPAPEGAPA